MLVALVAFGGSAFSQNAIDKYFNYLDGDTTLTKVTINSKMFELFAYIDAESDEEKEFKEMVSNLDNLKVLMKEDAPDGEELFNEAIKKPGKEFELLMDIDRAGERFNFFIKETNGIVAELLMIGNTDDEFIILSLTGEIDLAQLSKLSKQLNIGSMKHLEKLDED